MPKDFLQGASLTPTFIQHFKCGELKNAFKKHPLQNRTNVQIKGGGGQRPFEQCSKKLHFFETKASLSLVVPVDLGTCRKKVLKLRSGEFGQELV